jgi:hypothetical protein
VAKLVVNMLAPAGFLGTKALDEHRAAEEDLKNVIGG